MSNFLDKSNIERLYNLVGKKINQKYKKDITNDNNSLPLLRKTMNEVNSSNPKSQNDTNQAHIIKLSKITLMKIMNIYDNMYQNNSSNIINRNIQSLNIKNKNIVTERPKPSGVISNNSTMSSFNQLKQERNFDNSQLLPRQEIDFSDTSNENSITNVSKTYDQLMKDREIGFEELQKMVPENKISQENNPLNQQFTLLQNNTDEGSVNFTTEQPKNIENLNYEDIIQKEYEIKDNPSEDTTPMDVLPHSNQLLTDSNDYFPESKMSLQDIKKPEEYTYKTYNLIINSADRKWYGEYSSDGNTEYPSSNLSRYNYHVTFAPESDNTFKIPIYQNNEYIALDINIPDQKLRILKGDKELNTNGFTFKGKSYPAYDSTQPKGNVVDYEYGITRGSSDTIHINRRFKNIVSIKLKRIILPLIDEYLFNSKDGQIYIGCKIEPYMLVGIDEFDSNIVSSTTYGQNIFCKVVYSTEYSFLETDLNYEKNEEITQSRGYVHLINEDNDIKEFTPSPLSELNKLSLRLLRPDGRLYSNVKDDLQVIKITQGTDKRYLTLTLNKNIHPHTFKQSDKIVIKNLIVDNGNSRLPSSISEYLESGAYIFKRNPSINNIIFVSHNVEGYQLTVDTTPNDDINSYLYGGYDDITHSKLDWKNGVDVKGYIINMSHQHSYVFEVKTKEVASQDVVSSEII